MKDDCDSILPPKVSPLSLRDPLINIKQTILSDRSSLRYIVLLYIPLFEILSISVNICSFSMISTYDIYDTSIYDTCISMILSVFTWFPFVGAYIQSFSGNFLHYNIYKSAAECLLELVIVIYKAGKDWL